MILEGSHFVAAPRERVWALLTDPDTLGRVTPGCQRLTAAGTDEFDATITVGVAAVKGTYAGKLAILDRRPPEGYTLRIEGSGRAGFVRGEGRVALTEEPGGTRVSVHGDAQVGGLIASVGQRLLGAAGRMLLSQFFSGLEAEVGRAATA